MEQQVSKLRGNGLICFLMNNYLMRNFNVRDSKKLESRFSKEVLYQGLVSAIDCKFLLDFLQTALEEWYSVMERILGFVSR
ncbi:hypothetical protein SS50377_21936 [Spironucleus salmonicida]|uniref:Uncharacterized protein n=1 Tax=Spironucleus salmonicida TaxID=348837 RepID=V6LQM4_9EUKA|nr:hypothetical protein SS50377_21936 [Spironucleus salmonicida]|eukprot:EST46977.1 Hypothetical protein SS50377_12930 [Spironucleus salmonicida]